MISPPPLSPRANTALILAVLALFVALGYHHYAEDTGDDLSASYIGCRLIASGEAPAHLFAHDPVDFAAVGHDDEWEDIAETSHFDGYLHPYVQTPLWAWSLQPLCTRLTFPAFNRLFVLLTLLSFAALLVLTLRAWTPRLFTPWAIAITLVLLWLSTPFAYAMVLVQTHIFFVLLTVAALLLAQGPSPLSPKPRPVLAGTLLALAAAVKLTPAIFLLYWLLSRRLRAALAFLAASAALAAATLLFTGRTLTTLYLQSLARVSHILLVSLNNQSFAATIMGRFFPAHEALLLLIHPLPPVLSLTGNALLLLTALAAALLDRRPRPTPPFGALLLLVAATVLTPIAWTHYLIVLVPAFLVAADAALARRSLPLAVAIAALIALNLRPLATDVINIQVPPHSILRAQLFSGLGTIVLLATLALTPRPTEGN